MFILISISSLMAQVDMEQVKANDEFGWSVRAFHQGRYNEAILGLERSLSFKPNNLLFRQWLGRAYYYSGFEGLAISEWQKVTAKEENGVLNNWISILSSRRGSLLSDNNTSRLVQALSLEGTSAEPPLFLQPAGFRPLNNGSLWMASYGSQELVRLNMNGSILDRIKGGIEGIDAPFDIMIRDDDVVISEFRRDMLRILSLDGLHSKTIGLTGRNPGQLLGPQFLTEDDYGNIYVTEWGNKRVSKFSREGDFILVFGKKASGFEGLEEPTGILYDSGLLYVADKQLNSILVFDDSGNYLRTIAEKMLFQPEGISWAREGEVFYIAEDKGIYTLDIKNEIHTQIWEKSNKGDHNYIMAQPDINGNLWVSDFKGSQIDALVELPAMYSGLFVKIQRVVSDNYPQVWVEVAVEDYKGIPMVGLDKSNFVLSENDIQLENFDLTATSSDINRIKLSMVIEESEDMKEYQGPLRQALLELTSSLTARGYNDFNIIKAGPQPEYLRQNGIQDNVSLNNGNLVDSNEGQIDLGLRLAGNSLLPGSHHKVITYFSTGKIDPNDFDQYNVTQLADFLKNNQIRLDVIIMSSNEPDEELKYLVQKTNGKFIPILNPEGLTEYPDTLTKIPEGLYVFKYNSKADTDFGRRYLPLEVESKILQRSGRDESGYFAPLE